MENNSVIEFFGNLNLTILPANVAEYIRTQILSDNDIALISPDDEDFIEIKNFIEENYPLALAKPEVPPIVEPTPAPEPPAEPAHKTIAEQIESIERKIRLYGLKAKSLKGTEKESVERKIKLYKLKISGLQKKKEQGGTVIEATKSYSRPEDAKNGDTIVDLTLSGGDPSHMEEGGNIGVSNIIRNALIKINKILETDTDTYDSFTGGEFQKVTLPSIYRIEIEKFPTPDGNSYEWLIIEYGDSNLAMINENDMKKEGITEKDVKWIADYVKANNDLYKQGGDLKVRTGESVVIDKFDDPAHERSVGKYAGKELVVLFAKPNGKYEASVRETGEKVPFEIDRKHISRYEDGGSVAKYKRGERFYNEVGDEYRYAYCDAQGKGHYLNDMKNNGILVFGGQDKLADTFKKKAPKKHEHGGLITPAIEYLKGKGFHVEERGSDSYYIDDEVPTSTVKGVIDFAVLHGFKHKLHIKGHAHPSVIRAIQKAHHMLEIFRMLEPKDTVTPAMMQGWKNTHLDIKNVLDAEKNELPADTLRLLDKLEGATNKIQKDHAKVYNSKEKDVYGFELREEARKWLNAHEPTKKEDGGDIEENMDNPDFAQQHREWQAQVASDAVPSVGDMIDTRGWTLYSRSGNKGKTKQGLDKMIAKADKFNQGEDFVAIITEDDQNYYLRTRERKSEPDEKRVYEKGGGFEKLAHTVAKEYFGQHVPRKYQGEYGKVYNKATAAEVGKKVAAKVYREQIAH